MPRFKSLTELRDWWHGRDDDIPEPKGEPLAQAGDGDDDSIDPANACPQGGEHEPQEIRAATSRVPLSIYCTKCRQEFPVGE